MTENKDTNETTPPEKQEYPDVLKQARSFGTDPAEILQFFVMGIDIVAEDCEKLTISDIKDEIEQSRKNSNYSEIEEDIIEQSKKSSDYLAKREGWNVRKTQCKSVYEYLTEARFGGGQFDEDFFELSDWLNKIFPINAKNVHSCFHSTGIFPIIVEALGILDEIKEAQEELWGYYHFYTRYRECGTRENVISTFGEDAAGVFDLMKDEEPDYEAIVDSYLAYQGQIEGMNAARRLYDITVKLRAYDKYFLELQNPKEDRQYRQLTKKEADDLARNILTGNPQEKWSLRKIQAAFQDRGCRYSHTSISKLPFIQKHKDTIFSNRKGKEISIGKMQIDTDGKAHFSRDKKAANSYDDD